MCVCGREREVGRASEGVGREGEVTYYQHTLHVHAQQLSLSKQQYSHTHAEYYLQTLKISRVVCSWNINPIRQSHDLY